MARIIRAPADEIETLQKLPYADRIQLTDRLKPVVEQAQRQGIKIDPRVAALVGVAAIQGPKSQQLQKTANDARSASAQ